MSFGFESCLWEKGENVRVWEVVEICLTGREKTCVFGKLSKFVREKEKKGREKM